MSTPIPSAEQVAGWLKPLSHAQIKELERLSSVPFTTLWNIRSGTTADPRIETVRKLAPFIDTVRAAA